MISRKLCEPEGEKMLEEIEAMINDNSSDDYWYDDSLFSCQELINKLSDAEWHSFSEKTDSYPKKCKLRIVECLADIQSKDSISLILKLSNTENRDIFIACIDSLRDMDMSDVSDAEKDNLLKKVNKFSADASSPEKIIFQAFCKSINI